MSKARSLSAFISDPAIDASEIGSNAITTDKIADSNVTHAKLHTDMNLSGKTVTFAADQISGNAIHGGVISNFASTGIDDNATSTALTILSNGNVGVGTATPAARFQVNSNTTNTGWTPVANFYMPSKPDDSHTYIEIGRGPGAGDGAFIDYKNAATAVDTHIGLGHSNTGDSKLVVKYDGKVGIGTTTPDSELHVIGSIKLNGTIYGGRNEGAVNSANLETFGIGTSGAGEFFNTYTSDNGDQAGLGFIQGQFINSPVVYMYGTTTTPGNSFSVGRLTSTGANPGADGSFEPLLVVKQNGSSRFGGGYSVTENDDNGQGGSTAWGGRNHLALRGGLGSTIFGTDCVNPNGSFSSPRFYTGKSGVGRILFLCPVAAVSSDSQGAFWSGFITHDNYTQPAAFEFHLHVGYSSATSPNYYFFEKRGGGGSYGFIKADNPSDGNNQWYGIIANSEFNKGWMLSGHGNRMKMMVVDSDAAVTNMTTFKTV